MKRTFNFESSRVEEGYRDYFQVVTIPNLETKELRYATELITPEKHITIIFDYPLSNKTQLTFSSKKGFTYKRFAQCVFQGYTKIYKEDGPDGKYGIWGHGIEDLVLTSAYQTKPGVFTLGIDS